MRFALYVNEKRDPGLRVLKRVMHFLEAAGHSYERSIENFRDCDILICLGGDGTFLATAHLPDGLLLPTIGINLGSVGFLPEIDGDEPEEGLRQLLAGHYSIEERLMLEMSIYDENGRLLQRERALNDIVVSRGNQRIVSLDLQIDQVEVECVRGDGLIVSTPTGSTAYSLACGGPIIHPLIDLLLITPICPHTLHNRSYIAKPDAEITLQLVHYPEAVAVFADGREPFDMREGQRLCIRRSADLFRKIRLGGDEFYKTLPDKIQQRGKSK